MPTNPTLLKRKRGHRPQAFTQEQVAEALTEARGMLTTAALNLCQGRSKFGPLRRSKSRPVGEGVAVFVGRLERSLWSPFRAAQA